LVPPYLKGLDTLGIFILGLGILISGKLGALGRLGVGILEKGLGIWGKKQLEISRNISTILLLSKNL